MSDKLTSNAEDRAFKLRFCSTSEYGALCQVPSVTIHWRGTYTQSSAPNLEFAGIEEAHYNEAGEIVRLADIYEADAIEAVSRWMEGHGDKLKAEWAVSSPTIDRNASI